MAVEQFDLNRCIWDPDYRQEIKTMLNATVEENRNSMAFFERSSVRGTVVGRLPEKHPA